MTKQAFFTELKARLSGLPAAEANERFSFYDEMINDRIEDGLSEEEAVAQVGTPEEISNQILSEIPLSALVKEKVRPKRALRVWEIILLILGFPLWFPLLLSAFIIILSFYIVIWSLVISLFAIDLSLGFASIAALVMAIIYLFQGKISSAVLMLGASAICAGLTVLLFIGCIAAAKGMCVVTKKSILGIKSWFVRKEN